MNLKKLLFVFSTMIFCLGFKAEAYYCRVDLERYEYGRVYVDASFTGFDRYSLNIACWDGQNQCERIRYNRPGYCRVVGEIYGPTPVPPRPYPGNQTRVEHIKCYSSSDKFKSCSVGGIIASARVYTQHSQASCNSRSWGYNRDTIWVDKGCRATFEVHVYRR